jgi:Leucine Rich repeat
MQQAADTPEVEHAITRYLADVSATNLRIVAYGVPRLLTVGDTRCILQCLQENPRFDTLSICHYHIQNEDDDVAVLNVLQSGLPLCTHIQAVALHGTNLSTVGFAHYLLPVLRDAVNVTKLGLGGKNNILRGQRGGDAIRDLLDGNETLVELSLEGINPLGPHVGNQLGPHGTIGLRSGLERNHCLQKLNLNDCYIRNSGLEQLLLPTSDNDGGMINTNSALTHLSLSTNRIEGAEGGRLVCLLLQQRCCCFPALKVLTLSGNWLGPLGARAMAQGLTAASCQLEEMVLSNCCIGNDGLSNLVPHGTENRSLTSLDVRLADTFGRGSPGEIAIALAARCPNLDRLDVDDRMLNDDQQLRLNLLLERKRLCVAAQALAGSTFPVLFRFVEEQAHWHEHGLGAIFVILQNDGEDFFCTAHNRAME